jgi:excisionase family DNA binding protein
VKLLTIKETAKRTTWSTDFIRDEIKGKRIAFHKIAGRYYIAEQDLEDYIARARVAAFGERPPLKRKEARA